MPGKRLLRGRLTSAANVSKIAKKRNPDGSLKTAQEKKRRTAVETVSAASRVRVVELRVRDIDVDRGYVLPEKPPIHSEIALHFDAWFQTLSKKHQEAIRSGVLVTVPVSAPDMAGDEEFITVRSASSTRGPNMSPWQEYQKRRAYPRTWNTSDFLCEFSDQFRKATGYAYMLRGGYVGEDYRKVYALRHHHGNDVLLDAIVRMMQEWKKKTGRIRFSGAPSISVLFAYFNDITALMGRKERHGEQAEFETPRVTEVEEDGVADERVQGGPPEDGREGAEIG